MRGGRPTPLVLGWALLVALTLFAWRECWQLGFTDTDALADFAVARVDSPGDLWRQLLVPLTGGLGGSNADFWRPTVMLHYALLRGLFGEQALGWQLWDLGLHLGNMALVAWLGRRHGLSRVSALAAAAVVALHPLGVEVVPAVARSIDLVLGLSLLASLLAASYRRPALCVAFALLALGAKETAVALLPLVVLAWWPERRRMLLVAGALGLGVGLFVAIRTQVLTGIGGYGRSIGGYGFYRALSASGVDLLLPGRAYSLGTLVAGDWTRFGVGSALLALPVGLALLLRRRPAVLVGAGLLLLPLLLYAVLNNYNRRLLYVPVLGLALLVGAGLERPRLRWGVLLVALAWLPDSTLFHPTGWGPNDQITRSLTSSVRQELGALPQGTVVWVVDRCLAFESRGPRARAWLGDKTLNNCVGRYSLQGWADDQLPNGIEFRWVTTTRPSAPPPVQEVEVQADGVLLRHGVHGRKLRSGAEDQGWTMDRFPEGWSLRQDGRWSGGPLLIAGPGQGLLVTLP